MISGIQKSYHSCFQFYFRTETFAGNPSYKATMRLTITNVQKSDYGSYKCVAKNPRGEMDGTIKLYSKLKNILKLFVSMCDAYLAPRVVEIVLVIRYGMQFLAEIISFEYFESEKEAKYIGDSTRHSKYS